MSNSSRGARKSIIDLMDVSRASRDVDWLRDSLQQAICLELSTIPPYLCAMWSIIDLTHEVRRHIKTIAVEEMLHMGLACNMLTAIGGTPEFNTALTAPHYPGPLPGGIRPEMRLWLAGFSRAMVRAVYMEIETPEHGPITRFFGRTYPTIGSFYTAIEDAFRALDASEVTGERQLTNMMLGLTAISSIDDACEAIRLIREQGEGTDEDPFPPEDPSSRAHYYRFAEMYYGRELVETASGWEYSGPEVELPPAYPMGEVPEGGYAESRTFDLAYTTILDQLQSAWTAGDQVVLNNAVTAMRDPTVLTTPARSLMQAPRPTGDGNFGPSFQLVR